MVRSSRSRTPERLMLALLFAAGACVPAAPSDSGGPNPPGSGSKTGGNSGSNTGSGGTNGGGSGTAGNGGGGPGPATAFQPGRVTMRRLNSVEYDNTIRDLLGLDLAPAARPSEKFQFPADEWGDGFFNDGDVL